MLSSLTYNQLNLKHQVCRNQQVNPISSVCICQKNQMKFDFICGSKSRRC
ncbi:hypothetical protein AVDCRST_MAG92-4326 [uncultured Coleofasciculus sp.]|uniref:Uncharacterized protein n=1 Tax=uncultured Coleofasciculus sp. TaxID=1267456 RepID=A0A6J4JY41_9CYAN|nr:hypothetical protein AVDCRST_MAG92-4326 [uncultured Coleofasciculus sp.]